MSRIFALVVLVAASLLTAAFAWQPGTAGAEVEDDKVILVDLKVNTPAEAQKCYGTQFDQKKVELPLDIDDPLYSLEDFSLGEEPLDGPGCFMPEMKVIFHKYTYVFSFYCTSVVRYRNSAPYTPSSKTVPSDIQVTESMLEVLQDIHNKYFGNDFDPVVAARFVKKTKLDDVDDKVDDSILYEKDEDEEDDKDLEKDAIDKEGWFDKNKDPGLEEDETPEEEEEDGDGN